MKKFMKRNVTLMAIMVLLAGCGSGNNSSVTQQVAQITSETLVGLTNPLTGYTSIFLSTQTLPAQLSSAIGGSPLDTSIVGAPSSFSALITQLADGMKQNFTYVEIRTYRVNYTIPGYGQQLSGLVIVPFDTLNPLTPLKVPMISLQHPTQVLRSQSPSLVPHYADEELTVPYGTMLASMGYIVVIADYPGLGTNHDVHPYCLTTIAQSISGLIAAATTGDRPWSSRTGWDGRLFLMGYSEGGYATLVAARDIQQHHPDYNLKGVAALDGPYSLADTMRSLIVTADAAFKAPYFVPYVVAAYDAAYGAVTPIMQFSNAIKSDLVAGATPLNQKLLPMLSGANTSDEIDAVMRQVVPYNGPSSILTTGYVTALSDTTSPLYHSLQENDAYRGWTPKSTMQVVLYHNTADDLVPVGNLVNVRNAWQGLPNVSFVEFPEFVPGVGSVHAGALIPAYLKGMTWIDTLAYPQRH